MKTHNLTNTSLLIVRTILALVMAGHGAQKLLGWFGGFGYEGTMGYFTGTVGLPYVFALLIILTESIGMIALALGLASRLLTLSLIAIMAGAIFTAHGQHGFFMNWFGAQSGEGYEYHLLVIALSSVIAFNGAGAYSLDAYIHKKLERQKSFVNLLFS